MRAPVLILGAGPAGLTAAYELSKHCVRSIVLEQDSCVGGLARTVSYKNYRFDIGGHRFYTKVALIEKMWREVLGEDFITCKRLSRIYYRSKFFHYPIEPLEAFTGLGPIEAARCAFSYAAAQVRPRQPETDFETWISNRFGKRLYEIFFKTYTEKVWGMPCTEIRAEWAAQRIRGLSLASLLGNAFGFSRNGHTKRAVKTLVHQFHYPRLGPGLMWTRTRELAEEGGAEVLLNAPVDRISWEPGGVTSVRSGQQTYQADHVISSIPIRDLIGRLDPAPPAELGEATADFNYRDFLTVALIVRGRDLFPDNWIYIHEPGVKVGRIQNYKNWSADMVPDPETTCLGLEYFCFAGDGLWSASDAELILLAKQEVARLGLVREKDVLDGAVVRVPKAYPVYDRSYQRGLAALRRFLASVPNLQCVGRNGMHRYNNQDHSMLTAILAARNVVGGRFNLWDVHVDEDYLEDGFELSEAEIAAMEASQPLAAEGS
ncbi:MAG: NAD(P)/FAD-dependent oxidoreductase [Bryobacteraceae bacterium]